MTYILLVKCEATKVRACFHLEVSENYYLPPKHYPYTPVKHFLKNWNLWSFSSDALIKIAKIRKKQTIPLIRQRSKAKRVPWANKYLNADFSKVICIDKSRATLDRPDGWSRGWIQNGTKVPMWLKRQKARGGVTLWARIAGDKL